MRGVAQARSIFKFYKYGMCFLFCVNPVESGFFQIGLGISVVLPDLLFKFVKSGHTDITFN